MDYDIIYYDNGFIFYNFIYILINILKFLFW